MQHTLPVEPWHILFAASFSYVAFSVIYRLYFHPLAKYPGPKLAALTWYYQGYYELWLDGELVNHLWQLHSKYGPVVRIGPNDLHFSDPKAYGSIYAVGTKLLKDPKFYQMFLVDNCSFGYTDPRKSKTRRDILSPLFSTSAIQRLEWVIQDKIDAFIAQVISLQDIGKPINLHLAFRSTTLDIISSYCFAQTYNAITAPNFEHPILIGMEATTPMWLLFKYLPFMGIMLKFPDWLTVRMNPDSKGFIKLRKQMTAQIDKLLSDPSSLESADHEIIYHHLMTPQEGKGQRGIPSKESLLEEALNLLTAGSDTVGNACSVGTFYILSDKGVYSKLLNELRSIWPDMESKMTYEMLKKLPYLTGVIKESLRLSHGVRVPLPRIVPPGQSVNVLGMDIPSNVVVSMGPTFVHLNEDIFPDPMRFDPERWLQPNSRELDNYLIPFSRGPRACIGLNLAWCELYLIFANVFRKLDMSIYDTTADDLEVRDHFLPIYRRNPIRAIVRERAM